MEPLLFALFFAAVVVGYVLVHLRLVRFEEFLRQSNSHLQQLSGLRSIDERLQQLDGRLVKLAESVDRVRLDRVERMLDRLHDDLEDLREATGAVQHAVVQIPAPVAAPAADAGVPAPTSQRVVELVENRLLQLGYHDMVLLSDLGNADLSRDVEVQVECWRGGMPVKGRVTVRNGSVRDVALQTVATMFP